LPPPIEAHLPPLSTGGRKSGRVVFLFASHSQTGENERPLFTFLVLEEEGVMSSTQALGSRDFSRMLAEGRAEALDGTRQGTGKALGALLMDCQRYLLLVANHNLDPNLRANVNPSDLVQNTFLEAKRDFGQFEGEREDELLAWLACILRHKIANATRD